MDNTLYFNRLTPAELERLAILSEELGEAQQAVGKILRHGYENWNPLDNSAATNRGDLQHELGHVLFAIQQMTAVGDVNSAVIDIHARQKSVTIRPWLRHQGDEGTR